MSHIVLAALLQQKEAKPMSPVNLQLLGKHAATRWAGGKYASLTDAVVGVVSDTSISPEQVQRVVEHANHFAFSDEFQKAGSVRTIDFAGGPADPVKVMLALQPAKTASAVDESHEDYQAPPVQKVAGTSEQRQELLKKAFAARTPEAPPVVVNDPMKAASDMRMDVEQQIEHLSSLRFSAENRLDTLKLAFTSMVEEATSNGHTLRDVISVIQPDVHNGDFARELLGKVGAHLVEKRAMSLSKMAGSFEHMSGKGTTRNPAHPLCDTYRQLEDTHYKIAAIQKVQEELKHASAVLRAAIINPAKLAETQGLIPGILAAAEKMSVPAGKAGGAVGHALFGPGGREAGQALAENAVKYSPHAAAAYGTYRASQTPVGRKITSLLTDDPQQAPPGYYYLGS